MEKKKAPMSLTGLIVLIIFLAAVVGGLVYFFTNYDLQIMSKNESNEMAQTENKEKLEEPKVEELDKNSELVKELYSIVLKYNNYDISDELESKFSFYRDKLIDYNELKDAEKVLCLLNATKEEDYDENVNIENLDLNLYQTEYKNYNVNYEQTKIANRYSNVSNTLKRIFGKNGKIENKNYFLCPEIVEYHNDSYYIYMVDGGGLGNTQYGYSEIQKVEKNGDEIQIYDKYIYLDFFNVWSPPYDDELVHIYTSTDKTNEIGKEEDKFVFWDDVNKKEYLDKEIFGSVFEKYEDKLNTYKHTFQKAEDGSYYWVSSEIYEVAEDKENVNLKVDKYMVDESREDAYVEIDENNKFKIYMGWGTWFDGIYEIKENKLICKADLKEWEGGAGPGSRKADVILTFDIINDKKIKLEKIEDNDLEYENNIYEETFSIGMTYSIK